MTTYSRPQGADARIRRVRFLFVAIFGAVVLAISLFGFGSKFLELIALARGEADGAFAVTPVVNYLLASMGFLCLFFWAAACGMFRDIEAPKRSMLDREANLDAEERRLEQQDLEEQEAWRG